MKRKIRAGQEFTADDDDQIEVEGVPADPEPPETEQVGDPDHEGAPR